MPIPIGRWAHVKARLHLSEAMDGRVELWQDGVKLIDELLPNDIPETIDGVACPDHGVLWTRGQTQMRR